MNLPAETYGEDAHLLIAEQQLKRDHSIFIQHLEKLSLKEAIADWLSHLHKSTRRNYSYYMSDMMKRKILLNMTVGQFNNMPHERMVDHIKTIEDWSEGTRQVRASCYISFTAYLSRISQGWFRRAEPSTLTSNKTFFSVRDKCETRALTLHEWHRFIDSLCKVNYRDALIAKAMLQGAKRISEVLSLTLGQIDFDKRIINFVQSKTGGTLRKIPITYPVAFMDELNDYIKKTQKYRRNQRVFITKNGKLVFRTQLNESFKRASKKAKLPRVTPHVLRATWVTLAKVQGIPDSEVMKVTGHTSSKIIYFYDKSSAENNYSKRLVLI